MYLRLNQYRIACEAPNRYVVQEAWLIPAYVPVFKLVITIYQEITIHTWLPLTFEEGLSIYFTNYAAAADYAQELRGKKA